MNNTELARRIIDCLSDDYDDEKSRKEAEIALSNELSHSPVKANLLESCLYAD